MSHFFDAPSKYVTIASQLHILVAQALLLLRGRCSGWRRAGWRDATGAANVTILCLPNSFDFPRTFGRKFHEKTRITASRRW